MYEVSIVGDLLRRLYTKPLWAMLVFGCIFILAKGLKASLRPSAETINESAHNLLLILFNGLADAFLLANITYLSYFLFETAQLPHLTDSFWGNIPTPALFVFILFSLDFTNYCAHRLLHTKLFWPLHALHHSDTHMTWTTSYRVHILEYAVMKVTFIVVLGWLFLPLEIVAVASMLRSWHSKLIHCQLGWTFGPFRKVLASPNYHRWHHSILPEAYGKNLSDMFPILDIMFGTHYDPGLCDTELGVEDASKGFLQGQLYPFKALYDAIKRRLPDSWVTPQQIP